jgi:alcohol dehydrogenase YqhD (iron-dependent ADH family)
MQCRLAILTPYWMRYILNKQALPRFVKFARRSGGDDMERANKGIGALHAFFESIGY